MKNRDVIWNVASALWEVTPAPFRLRVGKILVEVQDCDDPACALQVVLAKDTELICKLGDNGLVVPASDDAETWLNDEFDMQYWYSTFIERW